MLFESVSSFPFDEGFEAFIVDKNQFMCGVKHISLKIFVIPHFSNEVFLPSTSLDLPTAA